MSTFELSRTLPEAASGLPAADEGHSPDVHMDFRSSPTLCERLGSSNLRTKFKARLEALESTPGTRQISERIRKCSTNRRCGSPYCLHCGAPGYYEQPDRFRSERHSDLLAGKPPKARNFRIRGGQRAEIVFGQFPDHEVHVFTIHLKIVPLESDVVGHIRSAKKEFLRLARKWFPDGVLMAQIEDDIKQVSEIGDGFLPREDWRVGLAAHDVVADIHIHGVLWLQDRTRKWITKKLKRSFPGEVQARITPVRHDYTKGPDKYGVRGLMEYASKRFVDLKFGGRNLSVFVRVVSYRDQLKVSTTRVERNVRPIMSAYQKVSDIRTARLTPWMAPWIRSWMSGRRWTSRGATFAARL